LPDQFSCAIETQFISPQFFTSPRKKYDVSGQVRIIGELKTPQGDGFLRMDFYSSDTTWLKTYVSQQLTDTAEWQKLHVTGIAPEKTAYATMSFQLDSFYQDVSFMLDDIRVISYPVPSIDTSEYPFYGSTFSDNFMWQMQL